MDGFWDDSCSRFTNKLWKPPLERNFSLPDWKNKNPYLTLKYYDAVDPKPPIKFKPTEFTDTKMNKRRLFNKEFGQEIGRLVKFLEKHKIHQGGLQEYVDKLKVGLEKRRKVKKGSITRAFKFSNKKFHEFETQSKTTKMSTGLTATIDTHFRVFKNIQKKMERLDDVIYCKQIKILPNDKQTETLKKWFKANIGIYNDLVDMFGVIYDLCYEECTRLYEHDPEFSVHLAKMINDESELFPINGRKLRDMYNPYFMSEYQIPNVMYASIVTEFVANIKGNITKLKKKHIKHFRIKKRTALNNYSLSIQKADTKEFGFYPTFMGPIKIDKRDKIKKDGTKKKQSFDWSEIQHAYKLVYDKLHKGFYIHVPMYRKSKTIENRKPLAVMDPGMVVFQELYGLDHTVTIGEGLYAPIMRSHNIINEMKIRLKHPVYNGLRKMVRVTGMEKMKKDEEEAELVRTPDIAKKKKKKRRKVKYDPKKRDQTKKKNPKGTNEKSLPVNLKRVIKREYKKINGLVTELHYKTCNYLCKNYDRVMVTDFSSKKVNSKKKGLSVNVKKVLGSLSHYRFRQRLQHKCAENRCQYLEVTEEWTSKTCSNCGNIKYDLKKDRTYKCEKCKKELNRDANGSVNIFIKNRSLVLE